METTNLKKLLKKDKVEIIAYLDGVTVEQFEKDLEATLTAEYVAANMRDKDEV